MSSLFLKSWLPNVLSGNQVQVTECFVTVDETVF